MKATFFKLLLLVMVISMILGACSPATDVPVPTTAPNDKSAEQQTEPKADTPATAAPAEPAAVVEPTKAPEPVTAEPVDIELWAGGRVTEAGPPPDDWAAYQIIKDELGINLKLVLLPGTLSDQDAKINTAGASNSLPDIFMVNRDVWYKLVGAGLVADVDELLPLMPVRTAGHYNDEIRNKLVMNEGSMYGLPDPGALPRTDGLVVRKDWLDKLGLEAPKTLTEFMDVAKAMTFNDPDGNGQADTYGFCAFIDGSGLLNAGLGPRFDFIYGAYGVAGVWNLASTDGFGLNLRDPNSMYATEYIKSLIDEKVIDPDWPALKKDEFRARWKQGKCGMMIENFAALSTKSNYKDFDANFPEGEWIAIAPPSGPDGKSSEGITVKSARIYAVSQRAMDAGKGPAIARLLEWMASEQGYFLLGFGQEGVNYKLDANGNISTADIAPELAWTAKETQPLTQLANMVYIFTDLEMNARYVPHTTANGRTIEPLAYYQSFTEMPWTEATGASIINPPSNAADFIRFYSENIVNFVLGQQPLDEASWATFVETLDSLGAQELEAAAKQSLISAGFLK